MDDDTSTAKKEDLQIDTDVSTALSQLTLSTSGTTDSGLTTPARTPATNRSIISTGDGHQQWQDFYSRVNQAPPKATRTADYDQTVRKVDQLLRLSDSDKFKDKSFDDLNDDQQAVMVFMVVKEMHECFGPSQHMAAKALIKALDEESTHKRMMSYVRLGGDRKVPVGYLMEKRYASYLDKRPEWKAETATAILKKHPEMTPFIHLQHEESYLCTYTACSAALYYCSYNNGKNTNDDGSIAAINMNVSRYIRDEVSGSEIANFTLTDMKGAYLKKVLLGLVKNFGTDDCQDVEKVATWGDDEATNYGQLKMYLDDGRPIVFAIETAPAFSNYKILQYSGRLSDYLDMSVRPQKPKDRNYHAVLCIGIKPRNGNIPPMLLVQDSCPSRPFFSIGLDLLMSMGMDDLQFYTVPKKWRFNEKMDYVMKPETRSLICGSPMSFENGVPRVLVAEEPVVDRRDMSRYLDVVDPHNGPLVYET